MGIVWLLNPSTQDSYAVDIFDSSEDALNRKDRLRVDYPANIFYHSVSNDIPEKVYEVEDALNLVNGEDIYLDVQD